MYNNIFFLHQIKHNKNTGAWDKGIVVKSSTTDNNFESVKQSYHAYLGAYAYNHDPATDYVSCKITDIYGTVIRPFEETWIGVPVVEPPEETEPQGE